MNDDDEYRTFFAERISEAERTALSEGKPFATDGRSFYTIGDLTVTPLMAEVVTLDEEITASATQISELNCELIGDEEEIQEFAERLRENSERIMIFRAAQRRTLRGRLAYWRQFGVWP